MHCLCPQCLEVSYQGKMTFTHMSRHWMRSVKRAVVTLHWSQELNFADCVVVRDKKLVRAVMQLSIAARNTRL